MPCARAKNTPGSYGTYIVPTGRRACRRRTRAASTSPGRGRRACPAVDSLIVSGMRGSVGEFSTLGECLRPVPAASSIQQAFLETHRETLTLVLSIPSRAMQEVGRLASRLS